MNKDILDTYHEEIKKCTKCMLQGKKVWDDGNPDAEVMIIAEAPGADEEKLQVPLIGRCGKLIEDMLEHIGLSRAETWRANCLVCRPPNNRQPTKEEIEACFEHLLIQINTIHPKIIVVLGKFAAQTLLNTEKSISALRGKWYASNDGTMELYVTFHPSYILRSGNSMIDSYKADWTAVKERLDELRSKEEN